MPEKDKYTTEEAREFEDGIVKMIEGDEKVAGWSEEAKATVYWYLNKREMTLERARSIRRKKRITGA